MEPDKAKKLADLYHKPKKSENFHVPKTNDSVWSSVKRRTQDVEVQEDNNDQNRLNFAPSKKKAKLFRGNVTRY